MSDCVCVCVFVQIECFIRINYFFRSPFYPALWQGAFPVFFDGHICLIYVIFIQTGLAARLGAVLNYSLWQRQKLGGMKIQKPTVEVGFDKRRLAQCVVFSETYHRTVARNLIYHHTWLAICY